MYVGMGGGWRTGEERLHAGRLSVCVGRGGGDWWGET